MKCSVTKPCFCSGKICLVPNNKYDCEGGNVFIKGIPFCGINKGWTEDIGKVICNELGFVDVNHTTNRGE